ncbi:MAG: hypothetical protein M0000_12880 [Actinomycetota bacterium]|nr:hypothetical protein [Actinomycetota bacterium]
MLNDEPDRTDALDLLARVRAQRGSVEDAKVLWQQILAADPTNRSARDALQAVEARSLAAWRFRVATSAVAAAVILAAFVVAIAKLGGINGTERRPQVSSSRVAQATSVLQSKESPSPAAPSLPEIGHETVGIRWHKLGSELLITFDRELFEHGTDLSGLAQRQLMAVADSLRGQPHVAGVTVVGCTDEKTLRADSPFDDNFSLGLARAAKIVEFLAARGQLPGAILAASSRGDDPDVRGFEDAKIGVKARTAVLKVTFERRQGD